MKKLLASAAVAFALALSLAGHAVAQTRTIKLATIAAANSTWHQAMLKFQEVVDSESNGRLKVEVFTDSQLGDSQGMLTGMQLGTLDMAYYGASAIVLLKGAEAMNISFVPYLFKDGDSAERILNGPEFQAIYEEIASNTGVRILQIAGQRSSRALQTTVGPITKPEDVKGLRIRIPPLELLQAIFRELGAQITPTSILEVYSSLARGSVDGQDNGFDLSIPAKYHEVAKHWSATDHVTEVLAFFASEQIWKQLSEEDRALVHKAATEAGLVATELGRELDANGRKELEAAGVTYTVPDKDAFRAALANVHKPYDGQLWPAGMVERIREMQQ